MPTLARCSSTSDVGTRLVRSCVTPAGCCARSGHRWGAAFAELQLGRLLTGTGELDAAVVALEAVRDQFASIGRGASVYDTSLHLADCLTRAGRPEDALHTIVDAVRATSDDVSIFEAARVRFAAEAMLTAGRFDEAGQTLEAGIIVARSRGLDYELSLLLAAAAAAPFAVSTGSDEPPASESARLLATLGVVTPTAGEDPTQDAGARGELTVTATSGRRHRRRPASAAPGRPPAARRCR